jgi:hypothetical protein
MESVITLPDASRLLRSILYSEQQFQTFLVFPDFKTYSITLRSCFFLCIKKRNYKPLKVIEILFAYLSLHLQSTLPAFPTFLLLKYKFHLLLHKSNKYACILQNLTVSIWHYFSCILNISHFIHTSLQNLNVSKSLSFWNRYTHTQCPNSLPTTHSLQPAPSSPLF